MLYRLILYVQPLWSSILVNTLFMVRCLSFILFKSILSRKCIQTNYIKHTKPAGHRLSGQYCLFINYRNVFKASMDPTVDHDFCSLIHFLLLIPVAASSDFLVDQDTQSQTSIALLLQSLNLTCPFQTKTHDILGYSYVAYYPITSIIKSTTPHIISYHHLLCARGWGDTSRRIIVIPWPRGRRPTRDHFANQHVLD